MKLKALFESMKNNLVDDAYDLEAGDRDYIGVIELISNFEKKITPTMIKQYEKKYDELYNSFDDPNGDDEEALVDGRYELSMKFLVANKLARKIK